MCYFVACVVSRIGILTVRLTNKRIINYFRKYQFNTFWCQKDTTHFLVRICGQIDTISQ